MQTDKLQIGVVVEDLEKSDRQSRTVICDQAMANNGCA